MRSRRALDAFGLALGRRPPIIEGVLDLHGLVRPVHIRRDRWGVPYIEAASPGDAWFGLGFCQGQDRAFQLEMLLRVVRGTLSEVIGADTLPIDRLSRRIGFRRSAIDMLPMLDAEEREALEAFAAGVNAGATRGLTRPPHEFTLLRFQPTPFESADVIGIGLIQGFALAANWDAELARLTILRRDGEAALAALDASYPEWQPVTSPPGAIAGPPLERLREDLALLQQAAGGGGGSNNWAIAAERTATGRPILANDPHLAPLLPSHWYLARVAGPDWAIGGACFAGTPGFAAAHNGHVAWGVTAGLVDNTDLFLEEIGPDGRSVRHGDGFVPVEVHREVIEVRGGTSVEEDVLVTPRGPIIGPALPGAPSAISIAATWLRPERVTSLFTVKDARTGDELRAAVSDWHGPTLNLVFADAGGAIGWQLIGQAPVRKRGHGTIPLAGWDPDNGWEPGHVPYESMPHTSNPPTGFIATANNRPTTNDDEPFLGVDWIDGYRIARITELLAGEEAWTIAATLDMQRDTVSLPWRETRDSVLGVPASDASQTAVRLLEAWDGDVSAASPGAAVFTLFWKEMQRRVAAARAPNSSAVALGRGFSPAPLAPNSLFSFTRDGHLTRLIRAQPPGWFDDWGTEMADALATVVRFLTERHGADPLGWRWGTVRPLVLLHAMGQRPPLDKVFDVGPIPFGGDFSTVSQAGALPNDPLSGPSAIASLRMAVDVGAWDEARFSLPGGQSGNPLSPHYDDQLEPWLEGRGIPLLWSEDAIAAATMTNLHLVPAI